MSIKNVTFCEYEYDDILYCVCCIRELCESLGLDYDKTISIINNADVKPKVWNFSEEYKSEFVDVNYLPYLMLIIPIKEFDDSRKEYIKEMKERSVNILGNDLCSYHAD